MRDIDTRNAVKAMCIVGGVVAAIGVIILAWPLFVALGGVILSLLMLMLPLILLFAATCLVYRYLQSKN